MERTVERPLEIDAPVKVEAGPGGTLIPAGAYESGLNEPGGDAFPTWPWALYLDPTITVIETSIDEQPASAGWDVPPPAGRRELRDALGLLATSAGLVLLSLMA